MLIGLTGGIGSGKSTVANMFNKKGIPVVDADAIAREVVEPGKKAWEKIVEHFGKEILLPDNNIDRKKLGSIIFNDVHQRKRLNDITHPIIILEIMNKAKELEKKHHQVIVDIPLLFESKREPLFDLIIVVYADKKTQLQRLMERDHLSEKEALQKIEAQFDLEQKKEKADIIIYNDKGLDNTEKQIDEIIKNWEKDEHVSK